VEHIWLLTPRIRPISELKIKRFLFLLFILLCYDICQYLLARSWFGCPHCPFCRPFVDLLRIVRRQGRAGYGRRQTVSMQLPFILMKLIDTFFCIHICIFAVNCGVTEFISWLTSNQGRTCSRLGVAMATPTQPRFF
jgi:hypothetical protein